MTNLDQFFKQVTMPGTAIQIGTVNRVDHSISFDTDFNFDKYVLEHQNENIYYLAGVKPGLLDRAKDEDVLLKNYFAVDFDIRKELSTSSERCSDEKLLKKANEIMNKLDTHELYSTYSCVIFTGNGIHLYFFGNTIDVSEKAETWKVGLEYIFSDIEKIVEFPCDHVCRNTSRILRIPESVNNKEYIEQGSNKILQIPGYFLSANYCSSPILDKIISTGLEEMERKAGDNMRNNLTYPVIGERDTYTLINEIPIKEVVQKYFTNWDFDGKHFFPFGEPNKLAACFVASKERGNYLVQGGSQHIPKDFIGYSPFLFVKTMYGLSERETFEWFEQNYPHIKEFNQKLFKNKQVEKNTTPTQHICKEQIDFNITTGEQLLKIKIKSFPWLVLGLIPEEAITAVTAETGKGKSLFILILAKAIAIGKKLLDKFEVKKSKVLIIDQEMDGDIIASRYQAIMDDEIIDVDYIFEQDFRIDNPEHYERMKSKVEIGGYNVVVFDTLTTIHNLEENDSGDMKNLNKLFLKFIRETKITLIYLHHNRKPYKGEKNSTSSARGSSEIISKAASHLILDSRCTKDEQGRTVTTMFISQEKPRRPECPPPFSFDAIYDPITRRTEAVFMGEVEADAAAIIMAKNKIVEYLKENGGEITINDLTKKLIIGKTNIRKACNQLIDDDVLDSHKGVGKYHGTVYYFLNQQI